MIYCGNCGHKRDNTTDLVCKVCGNEFEQSLDIDEQIKNLNTNVDMLLKTEKEVKPEYMEPYYKSQEKINELEQTISFNQYEKEKHEEKPTFDNDYSLYQTKIDTLEEQISEQKEELSEYREEEEKRSQRKYNLITFGIFIFFIGAIVFMIWGVYELYLSLNLTINFEDLGLFFIVIIAIALMVCLVSYSVKDF